MGGCGRLRLQEIVNMVKAKVKKNVPKNVPSRAARKKAGRITTPQTVATSRADSTKSSNGVNGSAHANGESAESDGVTLDAGSIKTKSGVDLTEKVRELFLLAKE